MGPKRSLGGTGGSRAPAKKKNARNGLRQEPRSGKRPRQGPSALAWGDDGDVKDAGLESDSEDEERGGAASEERKEIEEAKDAAEAEAKESADEKRLRLARDVLLKLDAEQRVNREDETDEEDGETPGDYITDRLAHARMEATGQLYREVAKGLAGERIDVSMVRRLRGHKLTPTCVVLSPDDTTAYSGSKDNSVVRWDVQTGKKMVMLPHWQKLPGGNVPAVKAHSKEILSVAVSSDGRYLASGGRDRVIQIWDCRTDAVVETFRGHQDAVSSLTFRANSLALFSGSHDRCVKHWDLNEMGYVETMFGHQSEINAIDSWRKERAVTGGRDRTERRDLKDATSQASMAELRPRHIRELEGRAVFECSLLLDGGAKGVRLWKVLEDSHLVFRPVGGGSIDCLRMLNEDWFVTGGEDGNLALWFAMKKKPAVLVPAAHGYSEAGTPRWISALACMKQSDLVVSGSNDGVVRLWRADVEARTLEQVALVPLRGFINGLAVSSKGKFFVAAVGQEHRLGRWEHQRKARNEICVVPLPSDAEAVVDMDTSDAERNEERDIDGEEAE